MGNPIKQIFPPRPTIKLDKITETKQNKNSCLKALESNQGHKDLKKQMREFKQ